MNTYTLSITALVLLSSSLSLEAKPKARITKKSTPRHGTLHKTSQALCGLTAISAGSIAGLLSYLQLEDAVANAGVDYANARKDARLYAQNLNHIDPNISSLETGFWTSSHILSRLPRVLLPTLLHLAITCGLGYLAMKLIKVGYEALTNADEQEPVVVEEIEVIEIVEV
jgi:hypothetical protein